MDLKRMRYFCTIAEQGSISKAAKVLNIAQPPLGKRLHELEEEIGSPLFIRTSKQMVLTEAGRFLYRKTSDILNQVNSVTRQAIDIASQKNARCVSAFLTFICAISTPFFSSCTAKTRTGIRTF
ncbi:UNVERIFIED_ORG: DNA-binding transcriptional LysR family regulator [Rahnella aquatilis]